MHIDKSKFYLHAVKTLDAEDGVGFGNCLGIRDVSR